MSKSEQPSPEQVIPHRPPFLFLEQISYCGEMEIHGHYQFRQDDPIFVGHFPGYPVVPGVLILEGGAQTLAYWALQQKPDHLVLLTGIEKAKWSAQVFAEQAICYKVNIVKAKLGLVVAELSVLVADQEVCHAKIKGYLKAK